MSYTLHLLPCRTDNYIWLIHNARHVWVIDPSLAAPVLDYISQHDLILADILITHHHHDHVEGIAELLPHLTGRVIGSSQRIPTLTENLTAPTELMLSFSDLRVQMLATHGHTYDHVSYFLPDAFEHPVLFCGDTIFSAGCGRIFDGDNAQYVETYSRLMQLPEDTLIACAHEYTEANLKYALAIDSSHACTLAYNNEVKYARARGKPSLPSTLAREKSINPYMRCLTMEAAWVDALTEFALRRGEMDVRIRSPLDAFTLCRKLKNQF